MGCNGRCHAGSDSFHFEMEVGACPGRWAGLSMSVTGSKFQASCGRSCCTFQASYIRNGDIKCIGLTLSSFPCQSWEARKPEGIGRNYRYCSSFACEVEIERI